MSPLQFSREKHVVAKYLINMAERGTGLQPYGGMK